MSFGHRFHAKLILSQLLVFVSICANSWSLSATDSLREHFQSPPNSAKPHTWWHWMNGYVSSEGITADLEAMKRTGIGGFQAFQIERRMSPGPVKYLSDDWRRLMQHAIEEADRLGLEVCFHNCAGWSSSGGPWITPEASMMKVAWTEQRVAGPRPVTIKLERPTDRDNYSRDIAVLAFPTPHSESQGKPGFRIDNWQAKAGFERDNHIQSDTRTVDPGDVISTDTIVDLGDKMTAEGKIMWDVPHGDWTVVRFAYTPTAVRNRPAPQEGRGYECDKLSKAAVDLHWENCVQKVLDDAGPLAGKVLNNILVDSYEVMEQNWTKGLEIEFQKRMGYDLKNYLPVLTGRVVTNMDVSERFLWDFRRVIADLLTENYYQHFADRCHRSGLKLSIEPYGKPGNLDNFAVADVADIPMGEWWARTPPGLHFGSSKMAASAAHTNGRRIVGAEAFTAGRATAAFVQHPYRLKAQGDYFFCQGVNRFIFHTFVHQPWANDVLPGMTMGPWGFQNNRNNTWYEQGKAWNEYLTRSQYLLQQGSFQADLCYFPGENAPQACPNRNDMQPAVPDGYDYDTISCDKFMQLTVQDGRIVLPGRMQYRVLVMPEGPVRQQVFEKAHQLLKSGGHLVWAKPQRAPGLQNYPDSDRVLQQTANALWGECDGNEVRENVVGQGKVYWPGSLQKILASLDVPPDVEFHSVQPIATTLYSGVGYEWIHRSIDDVDVYLISNQQEVARQVEVTFRVDGRTPQLWNAQTGGIKQAPVYEPTDDGRTRVQLFLDSAEAIFVVFDEPSKNRSVVDILHNGSTPFSNGEKRAESLVIHRATYGDLNGDASRHVDVTERVRSKIANNAINVEVKWDLFGLDPAPGSLKQLRVNYSVGQEKFSTVVNQNEMLVLNRVTNPIPASAEPATLAISSESIALHAWEPGTYELVYSDGNRNSLEVPTIPEAIDLSTDWKLQCPRVWGPENVVLDRLVSWTEHSDPELKYFSGTAIYRKNFDVPADRIGRDRLVRLDLGDVKLFAEVIFNGEDVGTLWKPPFNVEVTGLVQPGKNQLEIRVTNLWVNRLIGDERFESVERYEPNVKPGEGLIVEIPAWLENSTQRPATKAKTFTTWKFHTQDSPLLESGLLGPVKLDFAIRKTLEP
ncbi:glycosyl hydrolase [Aporhodopirellula aestuarii]|uniref:DnaJ-like protein C11 C-terminal domain-containing protein n=1 Tax=Aporhodopirellula aestuarii TaxID=2950107 RepID=A0ABT0UBL8_9BACT|nr:glycosyl hydrolase [Aporhodopirellula aestuarii]MCM2374180.1 hypothetical protein [Aporhodopirellula aestuarii]